MPVQYMNRTIWSVHDHMYTSLQLLEIVCWCRGFASGWIDVLALLLLVLVILVWFCGEFGQIEQQCCSSCSSAFAFWWLTRWRCLVDDWARFTVGEGFIWLAFVSLVDSSTFPFGDSLCVCAACTQPCEQAVCVSADALHLAVRVDQIGSLDHILSWFNIFANLPIGIATWHNVLFVWFVCRDHEIDQDEDLQAQD
jgi:hypothetical protein